MSEQETVKLLRECDAGVKMGVSSINEVLGYVQSELLKNYLAECRTQHDQLSQEIEQLLCYYGDEGKEPCAVAKGMSWIKTNVMLGVKESDHTIADLITDGCNMGVKSLSRYLNQYEAADEKARDIAKRLIAQEEKLAVDIRPYL